MSEFLFLGAQFYVTSSLFNDQVKCFALLLHKVLHTDANKESFLFPKNSKRQNLLLQVKLKYL